jgi:hypothetical protein
MNMAIEAVSMCLQSEAENRFFGENNLSLFLLTIDERGSSCANLELRGLEPETGA